MNTPQPENLEPITLREIYPHLTLTEAEIAEAEDRFDRYLELAARIFERLAADPSYPKNIRALTAETWSPMIESERSNLS
jgi:hypothetical protein